MSALASGVWTSADGQKTLSLNLASRVALLTVTNGTGTYKCFGKWEAGRESVSVKVTGEQCAYAQELAPVGIYSALAPVPVAEAKLLDAWLSVEEHNESK